MTDAFSTSRNRIKTLILVVICGLLAIAAAMAGIDDNPPGILLAFLAAITLVFAFAHPWLTSRQFLYFLLVSVIGMIVFVILNNVFVYVAPIVRQPRVRLWD